MIHNQFQPAQTSEITYINLIGISDMNIENICNRSIISDVYLWKINNLPDGWDVVDSAWKTLFADRCRPEDIKEMQKKIVMKKNGLYLVYVECSYGGAIAVICERVEIFKESS
jgi:hypothetical protein